MDRSPVAKEFGMSVLEIIVAVCVLIACPIIAGKIAANSSREYSALAEAGDDVRDVLIRTWRIDRLADWLNRRITG
jgi:hypothetical protein